MDLRKSSEAPSGKTTAPRRKQLILEWLGKSGSLSYDQLARSLGVASMTIRRDCEELSSKGSAIKVLGGIQLPHAPSYLYESKVLDRMALNRPLKRAIAREALKLITSQQTISLDGSTTSLELAKLISKEKSGLTILTNSALTCLELGNGNNAVIGVGGEYEAGSLSYVGAQAEDFARSFFVDLAFQSTKAFLPRQGTYESAVGTYRIKQIMAQQAVEMILLVDNTKFGQRALSKVLDTDQINKVVTDSGTSTKDMAILRKHGCEVIVAPKESSSPSAFR